MDPGNQNNGDPGVQDDNPATPWYIWLIIGIFAFVLVILIIVVVILILKKRNRTSIGPRRFEIAERERIRAETERIRAAREETEKFLRTERRTRRLFAREQHEFERVNKRVDPIALGSNLPTNDPFSPRLLDIDPNEIEMRSVGGLDTRSGVNINLSPPSDSSSDNSF